MKTHWIASFNPALNYTTPYFSGFFPACNLKAPIKENFPSNKPLFSVHCFNGSVESFDTPALSQDNIQAKSGVRGSVEKTTAQSKSCPLENNLEWAGDSSSRLHPGNEAAANPKSPGRCIHQVFNSSVINWGQQKEPSNFQLTLNPVLCALFSLPAGSVTQQGGNSSAARRELISCNERLNVRPVFPLINGVWY